MSLTAPKFNYPSYQGQRQTLQATYLQQPNQSDYQNKKEISSQAQSNIRVRQIGANSQATEAFDFQKSSSSSSQVSNQRAAVINYGTLNSQTHQSSTTSSQPYQYNYSSYTPTQNQSNASNDKAKYTNTKQETSQYSSSLATTANSSSSANSLINPNKNNTISSSQLKMTTSEIKSTASNQSTIKKTSNRKCGLNNIGNTCYMNSALQCVFNIPGFLEPFLNGNYKSQLSREEKGVAESFAELGIKIDGGKRTNSQFAGSYQQDSQEFLSALLDGLHNDLNLIQGKKPYKELDADPKVKKLADIANEWFKYYSDRDKSIITDFFTGQMLSRVKCQICENESLAFDNFMDLSLSFSAAFRYLEQYELDRLIQAFLKEEPLDDTYYCKQCKKQTKSKRQFFLWRMPQVLVISFKRFKFGTYKREKLNHRVSFPLVNLDFNQYSNLSKEANCTYDLIGLVNHHGTLTGGHYTAQCKNPIDGTWNEFDDEDCKEIDINTQSYDAKGSSEAYLLFYYKRNTSSYLKYK